MQNLITLKDEKRKISNLIKPNYEKLSFSDLKMILDNNYNEPRWMDVFVLLYKCKLPKDAVAYDIMLEKLSIPMTKFYFKRDGKRYIASVDENAMNEYTWYLINNNKEEFTFKSQYIPDKEYIKELLRYNKYRACGLTLKHIKEDEFILEPINYTINGIDDAKIVYEKVFDAYDLFTSLKLNVHNFIENFDECLKLGKDKRMIATLSTMLSCFECKFIVKEDYLTIENTNLKINNEDSAKAFEAHLIDTYQFFRNVVNPKDKRDIVSEIFNKKVSKEIVKEFEKNMPLYLTVAQNKDIVDWVITIAKESKYTFKIEFDEQGVFKIDGNLIMNPNDARDFYISYMQNRKEQTSVAVYRANLVTKIKKMWNIFKTKLGSKKKKNSNKDVNTK